MVQEKTLFITRHHKSSVCIDVFCTYILVVIIKNIRYINFINEVIHVMISKKAAGEEYNSWLVLNNTIHKKPQCRFWCAEEKGRKEPT